jgi:hypothetical protein
MVQATHYDNAGPGIRSRDVLQDTMYEASAHPSCPRPMMLT